MSERASDWNRLDNAAKIFPPTSNKQDTKVFRFACQLNERVEQEILQQATEKTLETFPIFRSVLKHGLFWYYLEKPTLCRWWSRSTALPAVLCTTLPAATCCLRSPAGAIASIWRSTIR